MMDALERFDSKMGNGFGTFARFHIVSRMQLFGLESLAPMRIFNTAATNTLLAKYSVHRKRIEAQTGAALTRALEPKLCPTGYATYGYGRVALDKNTRQPLKGEIGLRLALEQYGAIDIATAERWLREDVAQVEIKVTKELKQKPTAHQLSALVSFVYNVGPANFRKSSVLRLFNLGKFQEAASAFGMWTKGRVDGKLVVLPGLVKRRAAEAAFFMTSDAGAAVMPVSFIAQDVPTVEMIEEQPDGLPSVVGIAPQAPVAKSPEVTIGTTIAGAGTATASASGPIIDALQSVSDGAQGVQTTLWGIPTETAQTAMLVIGLVVAFIGIGIAVWRCRERLKGLR